MLLNDEHYITYVINRENYGESVFIYKGNELVAVINKQSYEISNFRILVDSQDDVMASILVCIYNYNYNWYKVGKKDISFCEETTNKFLIDLFEKEIVNI